ncbi:tyrosine-type recombinase/integrase [Rhodococcus sp. WAY2]|uniref:tyrosine-type recombinase/integrase n=1 Tax=Rhodococcus sp. WAY2 TaxID=2663121 RepID=UPI00132002BB|nr:site-specific integrase [Rhodococcus sp. WAY2]QHE73152.1 putative transposase [Rhodococcus sp. WAY2]
MSAAATAGTLAPAPGETDSRWRALLTERLVEPWRPGEWNPQTLIFTGDPGNPKTLVYLCTSAGCVNPTGTRNSICAFCTSRRRPRSKGVTRRFHDTVVESCIVTGDGVRCARPRYSATGLCFTHQNRFAPAAKTRGISLSAFVAAADPLPALAVCAVEQCRHQVLHSSTPLCLTHRHQYRARGERGEPVIDQHAFAARALPLIRSHEFTLVGCTDTVRAEVLWLLQERDRRGFGISMLRMRNLLAAARGADTLFDVDARYERDERFLRGWLPLLTQQRAAFDGVDLFAADRWGPEVLERFPSVHRTRGRRVVIDWSAVGCRWLRELGKTWAKETHPRYENLGPSVRALTWASEALETSPAFADPTVAGRGEIAAIIDHCRRKTTVDGAPYAGQYPESRLWDIKTVLAYGRAAGHIDHVPGSFVFTTAHLKHRAPLPARNDDEPGRALPDEIVEILDHNLALLRPSMKAGHRAQGWTNEDYAQLRQTIYQLLRDTGRRPGEITALRRDCLDVDPGGGPVLIYTNAKANRLDRRLHITAGTAAVITTWRERVRLLRPDRGDGYLFPQLHLADPYSDRHFTADAFGVIFRQWIDSIDELTALIRTADHPAGIIDRRDLVAYSLRHTWAQNHADAGTPVDVLAALMDHRNLRSTQTYYRIGHQRKREAIDRVGRLVTDRRGDLRPAADRIEYERRSVSTLLGGCVEPSNVKSGGKACPIRFQCGGCDHYRPDPSYIPEIEHEIRKIKADVKEAELCAAPQVVENMRYNLAMFEQILAKMTGHLQRLDPEERAALDAAIGTIRSARGQHRRALPLIIPDRGSADD